MHSRENKLSVKSLTRVCGVEGSRGGGGSEGLGDGGEPDWGGRVG